MTDGVPGGIMSRPADRRVMQLTYRQTCWYNGMTDRQVICLTYGWTGHVDGMTVRQLM